MEPTVSSCNRVADGAADRLAEEEVIVAGGGVLDGVAQLNEDVKSLDPISDIERGVINSSTDERHVLIKECECLDKAEVASPGVRSVELSCTSLNHIEGDRSSCGGLEDHTNLKSFIGLVKVRSVGQTVQNERQPG